MNNFYHLLACFGLFCLMSLVDFSASFAQKTNQQYIDSLLLDLPKSKEDTIKVKLLNDLGFEMAKSDPDKTIEYGKEALKLSEKLKYELGKAEAYRIIGLGYNAKSMFSETLDNYLKSLRVFEKINYASGIGRTNLSIGILYTNMDEYDKAIRYLNDAITIFEKIKSRSSVARAYSNIGSVYGKMKKWEKALEYYNLSLKIKEEKKDSVGMEGTISNIGTSYSELGDFDKALINHKLALELNQRTGNKQFKAIHLCSIGQSYYELSKDTTEKYSNRNKGANKKELLLEAKKYLFQGLLLFEELENLGDAYKSYLTLSEVEELLGNYSGSLVNFRKYTEAKDSLFNEQVAKKTLQQEFEYNYEKKEVLAQSQIARQKLFRNISVFGLIFVLFFAGILLMQRNKIQKEKKKSEELLLNILPYEVAEELKEKGRAEARAYDEVTILFTDFKGFTAMSGTMTPKVLVHEIDYCFRKFDEIIGKYGLEKIKTIGDAYMAVAGLPVIDPEHAVKMVKAALEIRDFMETYKIQREKEGNPFFEIRIGINTGEVVAGIVGVKKFAYDIWGDAVNIASRMESGGEVGKVNISESTYLKVRAVFDTTYRGQVEAKGKGEIAMYFVDC